MMKVLPIFALAIALLAANHSDAAEIYKWKDENGKVVFGSSPPPGVEVEKTGQKTGSGIDGEAIDSPDNIKERLNKGRLSKAQRLKGATLARYQERKQERYALTCERAKSKKHKLIKDLGFKLGAEAYQTQLKKYCTKQ